MAHIDDSRGGRTSNVDVNIVPFIDLMSVLIIFLLITAVWTQVSMIQIGSSVYGQKSKDEAVQPPPRAEIPFKLDIIASGYNILIGKQVINIPKSGADYNIEKLKTEVKKIKEMYPEKVDAIIDMNDQLAYGNLIEGMDALLDSGFPEISIATGGVE